MTSDEERCRQAAIFQAVDDALAAGDLQGLRAALGDPPGFPDVRTPLVDSHLLEDAIYRSPLPFIRTLLDLGANPNYEDHAGFPSVIAALSTERPDRYELVALLLEKGADVQQRGVNDYTPLHWAAGDDDPRMIELLLAHGADPQARTRIDDYETPLEGAERGGKTRAAEVLRRYG